MEEDWVMMTPSWQTEPVWVNHLGIRCTNLSQTLTEVAWSEKYTTLVESEVDQSCPTLCCDPVDCSPLGSSIHGILQSRILEWVAISFSRGSSQPRDRTQVSRIADRRFNLWATRETLSNSKTISLLVVILNRTQFLFLTGSWSGRCPVHLSNDNSSICSNCIAYSSGQRSLAG